MYFSNLFRKFGSAFPVIFYFAFVTFGVTYSR